MKLLGFYKIFLLMLATIPLEINSYSQSYNTYFYSPTFISPQNISTTYNGNTISGQYLTILGKNNSQITKPFIFVEGFDPLNNQGFQDYINVYNNNFLLSNPSAALLKTLYDNSYDVIMLNFNNANDYIQNNAMLLIALINTINQIKVDQTDNMVVMGFSMGGLVARYALTWMEANSQNHHTRLFISHDTPHKGANFPIGLQKFVQDFSNKTSWINMAGPFLLNSLNYALPAARQMLVYYYANSTDGIARPSNDKINFFNELFNLNPSNNGYPSRPLKVAISNGNYSGFNQTNLNNNDKILSFDYWKKNEGEFCSCSTWYLIWHWNCDQYCYSFASDHITATVRAGFSDANPLEEFNVYSLGRHNIGCSGTSIPLGGNGSQHFSSANYPYDIAPGSYSPVFMDQLAQTITSNFCFNLTYKNNTCFIPTISALDLNIDLATPFDPNASKCISMFDFVYANSTQNIDHWNLNDGASNFIINHLLANEATTQHRNVVIPANTIIQGGQSYPISATGNISNAGIFSLKAGSSSLLTSGTSVSLNAGFIYTALLNLT